MLYENLKEALNRAWFGKTQEQREFQTRNGGTRSRRLFVQESSLRSMLSALECYAAMSDQRALAWLEGLNVEGKRLAHSALGMRREALQEECRDIHIAMVSLEREIPTGPGRVLG